MDNVFVGHIKCMHGVIAVQEGRESLNLRLGLHSRESAYNEIDKHWRWPSMATALGKLEIVLLGSVGCWPTTSGASISPARPTRELDGILMLFNSTGECWQKSSKAKWKFEESENFPKLRGQQKNKLRTHLAPGFLFFALYYYLLYSVTLKRSKICFINWEGGLSLIYLS